jgi:hypothetical protein
MVAEFDPLSFIENSFSSYEEDDEDFDEAFTDSPITPQPGPPQTPKKQDSTPIPPPQVLYSNPQPKPLNHEKKTEKVSVAHPYYASPDKEHRIFTAISYLYWTVSEPGLYFAEQNSQSAQQLLSNTSTAPGGASFATYQNTIGEIIQANFKWTSGVRAEASYQMKTSPWQILADYSYLNTRKTTTVYSSDTPYGFINALGMYQTSNIAIQEASSYIRFNYQNTKLLLGTTFKPIKELLVSINFGPFSSWINQSWTVTFIPTTTSTSLYNLDSYNYFKNSSWAIGLFGGLGFEAHLGQGFALCINGGFAGMSGKQKLLDYDSYLSQVSVFLPTTQTDEYVFYGNDYQFMGQGILKGGVSYSRSFKHIALRLGVDYEFNALINMCDMYRMNGVTAKVNSAHYPQFQSSNIYLQGISARFGIGY